MSRYKIGFYVEVETPEVCDAIEGIIIGQRILGWPSDARPRFDPIRHSGEFMGNPFEFRVVVSKALMTKEITAASEEEN